MGRAPGKGAACNTGDTEVIITGRTGKRKGRADFNRPTTVWNHLWYIAVIMQ